MERKSLNVDSREKHFQLQCLANTRLKKSYKYIQLLTLRDDVMVQYDTFLAQRLHVNYLFSLQSTNKWEMEMATHSSILAWRISWTEEPGGLSSMGSHRVGHDWSDLAPAETTNKYLLIRHCFSYPKSMRISVSVDFEILCVLKNFRAGIWSRIPEEEETGVSKAKGLVQGHGVIC